MVQLLVTGQIAVAHTRVSDVCVWAHTPKCGHAHECALHHTHPPPVSFPGIPSTHPNHPAAVIIQVLEIFPAFALYRGLFELSSTAYIDEKGDASGTMNWTYARQNGLLVAIIILAVEWAVFLALGLLLDFLFLSGAHDSGKGGR